MMACRVSQGLTTVVTATAPFFGPSKNAPAAQRLVQAKLAEVMRVRFGCAGQKLSSWRASRGSSEGRTLL